MMILFINIPTNELTTPKTANVVKVQTNVQNMTLYLTKIIKQNKEISTNKFANLVDGNCDVNKKNVHQSK